MGTIVAFISLTLFQFDEPAKKDPTKLPIPFDRYTTKDQLGRTITFYLSKVKTDEPRPLPVILFIEGSGCQSVFSKVGEKISVGLAGLTYLKAEHRARVAVVEKPGVNYLDFPERPGSAVGASEEFLREHTLPRWAEANGAALRAIWRMAGIDSSRTLVMGHSEGGLVAARVAAEHPNVTHVASLATSGPTQLYSLAELQARPRPGDQPGDGEKRRLAVFAEWNKILADPDSTTKTWLGHPYRRWSTFLAHSTLEELLRAKANVFLAHGTEDSADPVSAFDVTYATLRAKGRNVVGLRIDGADHGFQSKAKNEKPGSGMADVFQKAIAWFLAKNE